MSNLAHVPARGLGTAHYHHQGFWELYRARILRTFAITGIAIVMLAVLSVLVQLVYPRSRALPGKRIATLSVGGQSQAAIAAKLTEQNKRQVPIKVGEKTTEVPLAELGLAIDAEATAQQAVEYKTSQRFVPFSSVFQAFKRRQVGYTVKFDDAKAKERLQALLEQGNRAPVDATIKVEGQKATVSESQPGESYQMESAIGLLQDLPLINTTEVALPSTLVMPTYRTEALQAVAQQVEKQLAVPLVLTLDEKTYTIDPATRGTWVRFEPDAAAETMKIVYDLAAIEGSLQPIAHDIYIAPTQSILRTLDGQETSRSAGAAGRMMYTRQAALEISDALQAGQTQVVLATTPISPTQFHSRSYSPTSIGLSLLLQDWAREYGSNRYSVSMKEIDGRGRSAQYNGGREMVTASMYKIFLASVAYNLIAAGTLNGGTVVSTGDTLDTCVDRMVVISSNPCAHAVGDLIGWGEATNRLHNAGFTATRLNPPDLHTTSADTISFLDKLHHGTLTNANHRTMLLDDMKRQIYRQGIPTGARGMAVANKVGYVDGFRHDGGIVYHPRGAYALAVYSYGGSYYAIADLTKRINNWENQ